MQAPRPSRQGKRVGRKETAVSQHRNRQDAAEGRDVSQELDDVVGSHPKRAGGHQLGVATAEHVHPEQHERRGENSERDSHMNAK